MSEQDQGFGQWCIVELMGHRRLGGFVSEAEIAGAWLLRIEIPTPDGAFVTQFYGPHSIYCLTPTTEEVARAVALRNQPEPVHPWEARLIEFSRPDNVVPMRAEMPHYDESDDHNYDDERF